MHISIIAAMDKHRVIGQDNQLPWHLPADLQFFKKITHGKPIVMGRKTYQSIGRPLPGRRNIVVSSQRDLRAPGCEIYHSLEQALCATQDAEEVMVIGGATIFGQALDRADRMYLTLIDQAFEGDTFFPVWDKAKWRETQRKDIAAGNGEPYAYAFVTLEK